MAEMAVSSGGGDKVTAQQEMEATELESAAYLNIATCHLKLHESALVIENAVKSLQVKPENNWKAYLRKGEGLSMKGDCDGAKAALQEANRATEDPQAQQLIQAELKKVNQKLKEQLNKQKQAFAGIFGRSSSSGSSSSSSALAADSAKEN
jgi:predicted negative regulator of RcsB-dependent stress response